MGTGAETDNTGKEKTKAQVIDDYNNDVDIIMTVDDETVRRITENRTAVKISDSTPDVILNNVSCAENLSVTMNYTKLYLAIRGSGVFKGHYHNLGTDIAKQLPDFLSNPDAIIKLDNGRLNMLTTMATEYGVMRLYRLNLIVQRI